MTKTHLVLPKHYNVMQDGTVVSKRRAQVIKNRWGTETLRWVGGRKLKPFLSSSGYLQVGCGPYFKREVHRLVAEKYIPNPDNKPCVNHKDGNKLNNHKDNLEWVTYEENMIHAATSGLCGGFYGKQKLVPSKELDIEVEEAYLKFGSAKAMAKAGFRDCDRTTISRYIKTRGLPIKVKVNQYVYQ